MKCCPPAHRIRSLNLTSMLDVCFFLLIFFLVTASFVRPEGHLGLPLIGVDDGQEIPVTGPILSMQDAENEQVTMKLLGDSQPIAGFAELYDRLARLKQNVYGPGQAMQIRPDRSVAWQHVVNALNQARRAEFEAALEWPL